MKQAGNVRFSESISSDIPQRKTDPGANDEPDPRPTNKSVSTAKYLEGSVGMLRGKKLRRSLNSQRNGVLVINLADGGSVLFYKLFKTSSKTLQKFKCLDGSNHSNDSSIGDSSAQGPEEPDATHQSIFARKRHCSRRTMLDPNILSQIEKVSVYVSNKDFEEPPDMPFLEIPAIVPWKFKTVSSFKNNSFQIVVPSTPEGKLDSRVKTVNYKDMIKKIMHISTVVNDTGVSFASVCKEDENEIENENELAHAVHDESKNRSRDDDTKTLASVATASSDLKSKYSQVFTFRCKNPKELAVYTKAAQKLGRLFMDNTYDTKSLLPKTNRRLRNAESMEIAAQTALLDMRLESVRNISVGSVNTIGEEEFRCYPLYAYPYSWMTKSEAAREVVRTSRTFHDLTAGAEDHIGILKIEVLQCNGLPKMDKYSLSDGTVYIVCGSSSFVTDTIPNNLNPIWLPLSRRACIFPVKNAYSQVHIGVFDYDGEHEMDDFIGKVVLDLPQFQSGFTYDVTLPLRETCRVYQRKQLGSIRIRVQLNWTKGERAALLSYFPKKASDITNRLKHHPDAITVVCPDQKSFRNIACTVYGKDPPGRFNAGITKAVSKEMAMYNTMMIYSAKKTIRDTANWKNPLLSAYVFCSWMHFVIGNSVKSVPAFVLSLIFVLLLRNYLKYNVTSAVGSLYGRRTIGDMISILLFNRDDTKVNVSQIRRRSNRAILERLLMWISGFILPPTDNKDSWSCESHSEFPFSEGSRYPKITVSDAMSLKSQKLAAAAPQALLDAVNVLDWDDDCDDDRSEFSDSDDEAKHFSLSKINGNIVRGTVSQMKDASSQVKDALKRERETLPKIKSSGLTSYDNNRRKNTHKTRNNSILVPWQNTDTTMIPEVMIPEQNISITVKSTKTIKDQIDNMHGKLQKANLHLFDDRVYIADENDEAEKLLKLNTGNNPIVRKIAPIMAGVMKLFDIELSAFRAIFNVFMWKDPMLSFWFTFAVFCLMVIFLFIPWRKLFFLIGLVGFGPQNWFLERRRASMKAMHWLEEDDKQGRRSSEKSTTSFEGEDAMNNRQVKNLSQSPLLLRNNTIIKPDGKNRAIIVPSVPFRHNRFYDWPPDPALTTIK